MATAPAVSKPVASAPVASKGTALNVGYTTNGLVNTPLWVAKERGFFQQNGLDVTLKSLVANAELPALISGELQYDGSGAAGVVAADLEGGNVVLIAAASDYPIYSLFANKKYTSVQDLAGQTIGITAAGSSTDSAARLFLRHFGMEGKVSIAPAGGTQPSIFAAMTQGGIAGGILSPPVSDQAAKAGYVELVNGITLGIPMNTAGVVTTRAFIKDRQDAVKRYLKAYQQAWTYIANPANEAEMLKLLARRTQSDEATVEPGYRQALKVWQMSKTPTVNPEAISNLLSLSDDPKVRAVKPADIVDSSLLESVQ
ncbi:MAG TPA: ABC transporter substrate-binding protein [Gemmataceae bacterium]|nr:ABC transporter substrate-binding protein [Gemmataceae bacterium]